MVKYGSYVDKETHYEINLPSVDSKGKSTVKIKKNKSEIVLGRWNDTVQLSVDAGLVGNVSYDVDDNSYNWSTQNVSVKVYAFSPEEINTEEGGFEYEIILNKKPSINYFDVQLSGHEDLDFFFQPQLTQEEISKGAVRPDNVINSYAVYHKTLRNRFMDDINYGTGKVMHIYRPKAIDADGTEYWGDMTFDENTGRLRFSLSQNIIDNAKYPLIIDPTFGNTSLGSSALEINSFSPDTDKRYGHTETFSSQGLVDSMSIGLRYVDDVTTADVTVFINEEDSVASGSHGEIVSIERTGITIDNPFATKWYDFTASREVINSSTNYILNATAGNPSVSTIYIAYDTGASRNNYLETAEYDTALKIESPWTETASTGTNRYSIYATYTSSTVVNYYFDGSDAAATDPDAAWTNETNTDDGNDATNASTTTLGSDTSNYIKIEGTNASSTGLSVDNVKARIKYSWSDSGGEGSVDFNVYTDGEGETLLSATPTDINAALTWSDWYTLTTPSGGWTWAKVQALETRVWLGNSVITGPGTFSIVQIQVTSTSSLSPSVSPSLSPSASPSVSPSPSTSPSTSPSPGWESYTRGDEITLTTDTTDLETSYTAQDYTDVNTDDGTRVGQTATGEYAIHQFKDYVGDDTTADLEWNGQTNQANTWSPTVLQIYNQNSTTWETVDSDSTTAADTDFTLSGNIPDLTNYKTADKTITCRVYQLNL